MMILYRRRVGEEDTTEGSQTRLWGIVLLIITIIGVLIMLLSPLYDKMAGVSREITAVEYVELGDMIDNLCPSIKSTVLKDIAFNPKISNGKFSKYKQSCKVIILLSSKRK